LSSREANPRTREFVDDSLSVGALRTDIEPVQPALPAHF
jgi:hypothetical protein